jgi:hypothetical protein
MKVYLGEAPLGVGATGKSSNQASLKEIDTGLTMTSHRYDFITLSTIVMTAITFRTSSRFRPSLFQV